MYLGIDLGTSGIKLLLLDDQHRIHGTADASLSVQQPRPTWSEQSPQSWWLALEQAIRELRAIAPEAWLRVRAIGLSGQMHGAVVLGASGEVMRPAILWNDGRSGNECKALEEAVPDLRKITGNLAMPGFTAPKILWLRTHEPALFARIRHILLPKDWLGLQLTGEFVSEMSDAAGTMWLNVANREWSTTMLAACGLDHSHMPRLVEGSAMRGRLRQALAQRWGLSDGVLVAGGGGDNAASAVGVGAVRAGQGFVSLGTSGVLFLVGAAYQAAPDLAVHAFAHALPHRWHQMSVMLSAASAFGWVTQLTGNSSEAQLSQAVAGLTLEQRARAPIFLPYLSGERTPHNDPNASGSFVGLRAAHGAVDFAYAVMEGVCFGLMDGQSAMNQGAAPNAHVGTALSIVGGGARSDVWGQILASGLNCPLQRPVNAHAIAALGAARLAWLTDCGTEDQVCSPLAADKTFEPDAAQRALLLDRYSRYRNLYPALRDLG